MTLCSPKFRIRRFGRRTIGALTPAQIASVYDLHPVKATRQPVIGILELGGGYKDADNAFAFADMSQVRVVSEGPMLLLYSPNPETTEKMYAKLKGRSPKFDVYRRQETPPSWHYRDNQRIGDLVVYVRGGCVAATLICISPVF